jgi:hypothetical protein
LTSWSRKGDFLNWIKWIFIIVFGRLVGYRIYRFELSDGSKFVCLSQTPEVAQWAFNREEERSRANRERIIRTLTDGAKIGRREVPDELVRDVLGA